MAERAQLLRLEDLYLYCFFFFLLLLLITGVFEFLRLQFKYVHVWGCARMCLCTKVCLGGEGVGGDCLLNKYASCIQIHILCCSTNANSQYIAITGFDRFLDYRLSITKTEPYKIVNTTGVIMNYVQSAVIKYKHTNLR